MQTKPTPRASTVNRIAAGWIRRFPESESRIERAVALVDNVVPGDISDRIFFVEGSQGHRYMIRTRPVAECSCPDCEKGNECKHLWAARLYVAGQKAEADEAQLKLF